MVQAPFCSRELTRTSELVSIAPGANPVSKMVFNCLGVSYFKETHPLGRAACTFRRSCTARWASPVPDGEIARIESSVSQPVPSRLCAWLNSTHYTLVWPDARANLKPDARHCLTLSFVSGFRGQHCQEWPPFQLGPGMR